MKKKDGEMTIALERTTDILSYISDHRRPDQTICGFSMETQNMVENSRKKLIKKKLDMIVANNLIVQGAGFGTDTNIITLITKDQEIRYEIMSKEMVADRILDQVLLMRKK